MIPCENVMSRNILLAHEAKERNGESEDSSGKMSFSEWNEWSSTSIPFTLASIGFIEMSLFADDKDRPWTRKG